VAGDIPHDRRDPRREPVELGDWGVRAARWDELDLVRHWRQFLGEPDSYFRRVL
jgi:hypothetical protein